MAVLYATIWKDYEENNDTDWVGVFPVSNTLTFATQIQGGFASASFSISLPRQRAYNLYTRILGFHVKIHDTYLNLAFEGYISELGISENLLNISLLGYYAKAGDLLDDRIYPTGPTTLATIIGDAADLIDAWNREDTWLSGADFDLSETDPETGAWLGLDFTDLKISEAVERCLGYGYSDSDASQACLTIYEGRYPRLFSAVNELDEYAGYFITEQNIDPGSDSMAMQLASIYNRIFAIYANEGEGTSKTTAADSDYSQDRFGIREGVVQNGGNPEGLAMAEDLRDYALEKYQWPTASIQVTVRGMIKTFAGERKSPYHIRAGDLVNFTDLDVTSAMVGMVDGQIINRLSAFVVSTNYTASSDTNALVVGLSDQSFEVLMSRLGLSGGLK